jgi:hypothetical protein
MLKIVHFQNVFGAVNGMVPERCNNGLNIPKWKSEEAVNQRRIYHTMVKEGYTIQWSKKYIPYNGQRRIYHTMVKEGYTIQWSKKDIPYNGQRKRTKGQTVSYKTLHRKLKDRTTRTH